MLKPQDIVVLLKLVDLEKWTYESVAEDLGLSPSAVHSSLKRCDRSGLYKDRARRILKSALKEFLVHGVRYSFPAKPGSLVKGIPTAHSAEPLNKKLVVSQNSHYVWSCQSGNAEGKAIEPLHKCVPQAVQKDPKLYQLLTITDGLRVGKPRDREVAQQELDKILA